MGLPLRRFSIGFVVLIVTLFLWIAAPFIYGEFTGIVRDILTIYLIFFAVAASSYAVAGGPPVPIFRKGLDSLQWFVIGFVATLVVMFLPFISQLLLSASVEIIILAAGFGLLHSFVKAYIEEIIFRWIIPIGFLGKVSIFHKKILTLRLSDWTSNVLFAVFHLAVLAVTFLSQGFTHEVAIANSMMPMFILFILGMIWSKMRDIGGIAMSWGSHVSYNMVILGVWNVILFGIIV